LKKAAGVSGGKDECEGKMSAIERERTRLLDGHRNRYAWRVYIYVFIYIYIAAASASSGPCSCSTFSS